MKSILSKIGNGCKQLWQKYKRLYKGPWYKKLTVGFLSFIAFVVFYCFAVMFNLFWLFGKSPSINDIRNPKTAMASEIYSADGKLLGKFFNENRSLVPYDSISPAFFDALVATEDERFYSHHGIDFQAIFAATKDAAFGRARGASTITQQLVKNMFRVRTKYSTGLLGKIPGLGIVIMKSKEMILAVGLEMFSTKKEIITMYANTVDFGSNAYGIKTAAKTYFNKKPSELTTEEAAVLVGLLKATSAYNPRINPQNSLKRRNQVLANMVAHGKLTEAECKDLQAREIKLNFNVESAYDGTALYFRQAVADYLKEKAPDLDVYSDGLKIYTTLDSRMQRYAEEAVREQMRTVQRNFDNHWRGMGEPWRDEKGNLIPHFIEDIAQRTDFYKALAARFPNNPDSIDYYLNLPHPVKLFGYDGEKTEIMSSLDSIRYMVRFMHTGFVAMEPASGYVKAWVGDIDFKTWKYDKVKAMRQPGSTFKLFVYAAAMETGLTPSDTEKDEPISMNVPDKKTGIEKLWQPHNANGRFSYADLPLRSAFAQSVNTVAVKLGQRVGIDRVVETAKRMGIHSPLDATPSLPLGSSDVNLLELVDGYACVANGGVHVEPVLVTKVIDSEGDVVFEATAETSRALTEKSAFYMQKMLEAGVRDAGGTSQALGAMMYLGSYNNRLDFGGKTGTSNNHSDAWFVGVTPALVGGAWVGGEYRSIHFRTGALGQGSKTALPIFGLFMRKVLDDPALRESYLKKYGAPPADIEPSSYANTYYQAPAVADTLAMDSLSDEDVTDLMGNPMEAPTEATPPAGNSAGEAPKESKPATAAPVEDKKKTHTETLFD